MAVCPTIQVHLVLGDDSFSQLDQFEFRKVDSCQSALLEAPTVDKRPSTVPYMLENG